MSILAIFLHGKYLIPCNSILALIYGKSNDKPQRRQIITPELKSVIERKKLYKKFMREKLAIALEKQKAGKRIHISEFKLIEDSKKKF